MAHDDSVCRRTGVYLLSTLALCALVVGLLASPNAASQANASSGNSDSATVVAAGGSHSCAVIDDGTVKCWGLNNSGQLGDGTQEDSFEPVSVEGLTGVVDIALGGSHSCALTLESEVKCWGANWYGQLADGTTNDRSTPKAVENLTEVTDIAAGEGNMCAVTSGEVKCWGSNSNGESGQSPGYDLTTPVKVNGLTQVEEISVGYGHGCAVTIRGDVKCWGSNMQQQLGDGTDEPRLTPVEVVGLDGSYEVAVGSEHSCALTYGGLVKCWGVNTSGQLGHVDDWVSAPTGVTDLIGASALAAGWEHTCALLNGGAIKCWGGNSDGVLGDGKSADRHFPDFVADPGPFRALASGFRHSCALTTGGGVKCWGNNLHGALGDRTNVSRTIPVEVHGLSGASGHQCPAAYFVGVPGSGEQNVTPENLKSGSRTLWNVRNGLDEALRLGGINKSDVKTVIVDYPAMPVDSMLPSAQWPTGLSAEAFKDTLFANFDTYMEGARAGVFNLEAAVWNIAQECGAVPIMIAGYSQGAMVAHNWLNGHHIEDVKQDVANVVSVALVADPLRVPNSRVANYGSANRSDYGACSVVAAARCNGTSSPKDVFEYITHQLQQVCDTEDIVCDSGRSVDRLWATYLHASKPKSLWSYVPLAFSQASAFRPLFSHGSKVGDAVVSQYKTMEMTHTSYGKHKEVENVGFNMGMGAPL